MIYLAEVLILIVAVIVFMALVIVAVEYDKAHKWEKIYKRRGRDDE